MTEAPKKTSLMKAIERANGGREIRDLLVETYNTRGTVIEAAKALGVSPAMYQKWLRLFNVEIKTVAG